MSIKNIITTTRNSWGIGLSQEERLAVTGKPINRAELEAVDGCDLSHIEAYGAAPSLAELALAYPAEYGECA